MDIEVSGSTQAVDVLAAYVAVRPTADVQTKIVLSAHAEALLKGGWPKGELVTVAEEFARLGIDTHQFAWWAVRRRRVRVWWLED